MCLLHVSVHILLTSLAIEFLLPLQAEVLTRMALRSCYCDALDLRLYQLVHVFLTRLT